jgi:uncharacterized protein (UPF0332 family)
MRGYDFLKLARNLQKRNCENLPSEALRRTIVNRTYYGVLHTVAFELEKIGKFKRKRELAKIHSIIIGRLKQICPSAGEWLEKLHELRKKADYDLHLPFLKEDLKLAQVLADLILKEVNKCLTKYRWTKQKKKP